MTRNLHQLADQLPKDDEIEAWASRLTADAENAPQSEQQASTSNIVPFNLNGVAPCVAKAHAATKAWLLAIINGAQPYNLSLLGPSGCGKTHLATNARLALKERHIYCVFRPWARILSEMKSGDAEHIKTQLAQLPVLVLDDIGAENMGSEYRKEESASQLCDLLDRRKRKPTLLTSNLSLAQIDDGYDSRVASRLCRNGAVVIEMQDAEDYALRMFKANSH